MSEINIEQWVSPSPNKMRYVHRGQGVLAVTFPNTSNVFLIQLVFRDRIMIKFCDLEIQKSVYIFKPGGNFPVRQNDIMRI